MNTKKIIFLILKIALAVLIFRMIFNVIDLKGLVNVAEKADPFFLLTGVLIYAFCKCLIAEQMRLILKGLKIDRKLAELLRIDFISAFYSFLGEIIGGAVRWYKISASDRKRSAVFCAIVIQQTQTVLAAYLGLCAGFFFSGRHIITATERGGIIVLIITAGSALAAVLMLLSNPIPAAWLKKWVIGLPVGRIFPNTSTKDKIVRFFDSFHIDGRYFGRAFLMSLISLVIGFLAAYSIFFSIGIRAPVIAIVWILPAVSLINMLPITIYGLGVREGLFILFLSRYSVPPEQAFMASILIFMVTVIFGITGGLLDLRQHLFKKSDHEE